MAVTVDLIYSILNQSPSYNSNLTKKGNQISVYFSGLRKDQRIAKLVEIRDYIKTQAPQYASVTAYNRTTRFGSSIGRIEIGRTGNRDIIVFVKPVSLPLSKANWKKNEDAIPDAFKHYTTTNEIDSIDIKFIDNSNNKKIFTIANVTSVESVSTSRKKEDIIIKTDIKTYKISIKMPKFRSWESYSNNKNEIKREAEKIIKNLYNPTASFQSKGTVGVTVVSTLSEMKKVCYGEVEPIDFIFKSQFSPSSFKYEDNTLIVSVDKIYGKNPTDYEEVRKDCHMLIQKVDNKSMAINSNLMGYKISYVPKSIADTGLPGKR
jgi:hypothetical protein